MPTVQARAGTQTAFDLRRIEQESFVRQLQFHPVLPSTNDLALELAAQQGLATPVLVLTEQQTAGRGRGSNRWWSQPGALTFSLVLDSAPLRLNPNHWPRVSLTAALTVCQVLEQLLPHIPCGIRWPNDVHCGGRKICGVLPELSPQRVEAPLPPRLVLGIGVNVNNSLSEAPPDVSRVGVSLLDLTHHPYDLTEFLVHVLRQLASGLDALTRGDPQLAGAVSRRCLLQGRVVELRAGPRHVRGLCQGIDNHGALTIHTARGNEHFFGGVVLAVH
jgi:BirA family transcriptional regulator, biotin operon repressor / biotin---[acetyl-CoA-carboxylase] ligase